MASLFKIAHPREIITCSEKERDAAFSTQIAFASAARWIRDRVLDCPVTLRKRGGDSATNNSETDANTRPPRILASASRSDVYTCRKSMWQQTQAKGTTPPHTSAICYISVRTRRSRRKNGFPQYGEIECLHEPMHGSILTRIRHGQ
jgi:hypothetical protein